MLRSLAGRPLLLHTKRLGTLAVYIWGNDVTICANVCPCMMQSGFSERSAKNRRSKALVPGAQDLFRRSEDANFGAAKSSSRFLQGKASPTDAG